MMCIHLIAIGQPPSPGNRTFTYNGEDAILDELNLHHTYYLGCSYSFVEFQKNLYLPLVLCAYFEYKYLFLARNESFNISANLKPQLSLLQYFMMRAPISVNLNFGSEADTHYKDGFGYCLGAGYEMVESTFDFREESPFIRVDCRVDNVKVGFQYKTAKGLIMNYSVSLGVMLDL